MNNNTNTSPTLDRLDNTEMIQETLMAHNRYRMTHNVKKVVLNHELNSTAQDHANHMGFYLLIMT